MFIKRSKYYEIGIKEEALETLGVDSEGYLQHPLEGIVGKDGETTLADLIAEALGVDTYATIDSNQYLAPEIINWCSTHQEQNHIWKPNTNI
jgi:hypothetical protein